MPKEPSTKIPIRTTTIEKDYQKIDINRVAVPPYFLVVHKPDDILCYHSDSLVDILMLEKYYAENYQFEIQFLHATFTKKDISNDLKRKIRPFFNLK